MFRCKEVEKVVFGKACANALEPEAKCEQCPGQFSEVLSEQVAIEVKVKCWQNHGCLSRAWGKYAFHPKGAAASGEGLER